MKEGKLKYVCEDVGSCDNLSCYIHEPHGCEGMSTWICRNDKRARKCVPVKEEATEEVLTITKKEVLAAVEECPAAKPALEKMYPSVFDHGYIPVPKADAQKKHDYHVFPDGHPLRNLLYVRYDGEYAERGLMSWVQPEVKPHNSGWLIRFKRGG